MFVAPGPRLLIVGGCFFFLMRSCKHRCIQDSQEFWFPLAGMVAFACAFLARFAPNLSTNPPQSHNPAGPAANKLSVAVKTIFFIAF